MDGRLVLGVKLQAIWQLLQVTLKMNNLFVVQLIMSSERIRGIHEVMIENIKRVSSSNGRAFFKHIFRKGNWVANRLTRLAFGMEMGAQRFE